MRFLLPLLLLVSQFAMSGVTIAQIDDPVKWKMSVESAGNDEYNVVAKGTIDKGWHIFSLVPSNDPEAFGPNPTTLEITPGSGLSLVGDPTERTKYTTHFDPYFNLDLNSFEHEAIFVQRVKVDKGSTFSAKAQLNFQACTDEKCIFPDPIDFMVEFLDGQNPTIRILSAAEALELEQDQDGTFAEPTSQNQIYTPVKWEFSAYAEKEDIHLVFKATVDEGWHIYSQNLESMEGPLPTSFTFDDVSITTPIQECDPHVEYDKNFQMDLKYFAGDVYYWTKIKKPANLSAPISGYLSYMVCDSTKCLPPEDVDFSFSLQNLSALPSTSEWCATVDAHPNGSTDDENQSLWIWFILGMGFGFAALLTPCVFPMIPMTVSFFTKQSKTKAAGIKNAVIYGLFIIAIYTGLGLLLSAVFGPDVLNVFSTDPYFNLGLFALLVIFGISFLGAFEIQLPASWANKFDRASDRGGLVGIFFMAATLAVVSFSCTGPLVGSALAGAARGGFAAPASIMFGFSLALALPFTLFAAFPGWLNSLPKSGGWLNSVKVVLGLLEIGFAFKFLSNADLVWQLGLLNRELFIAIWIAVALIITLYLFGKLRFPHDSPFEKLSVTRFLFAFPFAVLAIYMIPGLWGAPLKIISGFPPPMFYAESAGTFGGGHESGSGSGHVTAHYSDYDEALAAAIEADKPLLIDYTGWACVNCRKMEETIWTVPKVAEILNNDVILVSLYVDERTKLPAEEQRVESYAGKDFKIKTIGNKWSFQQVSKYHTNAQPFYVMVDNQGKQLGGLSASYDSDPAVFVSFLKSGVAAYKKK